MRTVFFAFLRFEWLGFKLGRSPVVSAAPPSFLSTAPPNVACSSTPAPASALTPAPAHTPTHSLQHASLVQLRPLVLNSLKVDIACYSQLPTTCSLLPAPCSLIPDTWYLLVAPCYLLPAQCSSFSFRNCQWRQMSSPHLTRCHR